MNKNISVFFILVGLWCILPVLINYGKQKKKYQRRRAHWRIQHHVADKNDYEMLNDKEE